MISGMSAVQWAEQLTAVERAGKDQLYSTRQTQYDSQLDAYKLLESSLDKMTADLEALGDDAFNAKSGSISDESVAKVTVGPDAPAGNYNLEVSQLAQASQVTASFASEDALLPTSGVFEIDVNGDKLTIDFATMNPGGTATVEGLRDYINKNAVDMGVQASLMRKGDGSVELLLTSTETGVANQISVTQDDNAFGFTDLVVGQDAKFKLNGIDISSSTNYVEDVIDGVSLELMETHEAGKSSTITVDNDTESTMDAVKDFVNSYNKLMSEIAGLTQSLGATVEAESDIGKDDEDEDSEDAKQIEEDQLGVLKGDSSIRMLKGSLQNVLFTASDNGMRLGDVGIELDRNGKLTIDEDKLEKALKSDSASVEKMFTSDNGYLNRLDKVMDPFTKRDGFIDMKKDNIDSRIERLEDDIASHDYRMKQTYDRYLAQFTAMEGYISSMNSSAGLFY
ncbi:flagellar filament capping protein FliD [Ferrimonas sp. SCSIO 43195]|nr:flagellar filament capping protein FliD [Ferrimonas sp. SCSIO 43195]